MYRILKEKEKDWKDIKIGALMNNIFEVRYILFLNYFQKLCFTNKLKYIFIFFIIFYENPIKLPF